MRFIIFDTVVLFVALIGSIIEKRNIDKQQGWEFPGEKISEYGKGMRR